MSIHLPSFGCSYYDNQNLYHFQKDLEYLKTNNINHLILCFSENASKYYKDNFYKMAQLCHESGMETWIDPWGWGGIFGGEAFTRLGAWEFDAQQIITDKDKKKQPVPLLCPNNPLTFELIKKWIDSVYETDSETIFWDEPHFFNPLYFGMDKDYRGCCCKYCKDKFHSLFDEEFSPYSGYFKLMQKEAVEDFIRKAADYSKSKKLNNSVCILPDYGNLELFSGELEKYFLMDSMDTVGTDPYWPLFRKELTLARQIGLSLKKLSNKHNKKCNYWIQGFRIQEEHIEGIKEELNFVGNLGIDYISMWSFKATDSLTYLKNFDNKTVWKTYLRYIRQL